MTQKPPKTDAEIVTSIIHGIIEAGGRGELTRTAIKVGMKVSDCRKRLYKAKRPLDEPTMRFYIIVSESKAKDNEKLTEEVEIDGLIYGKRKDQSIAWRCP